MNTQMINISIKTPWTNKLSKTVAVASLIAGAVIFFVAYYSALSGNILGYFNQPILNFMVSIRQEDLTNYMSIITLFGSITTIAIITISIAVIWASYKKEFWRPILLVISMLVTAVIATTLKSILMIKRPLESTMIAPFETDFALPSGHTISIFVIVLIIGYLICSRRSSTTRIITWALTAIVLTAIISISRLYLGYHWLTDVTASVGLGLVILGAIILVDKAITNKFPKLQ